MHAVFLSRTTKLEPPENPTEFQGKAGGTAGDVPYPALPAEMSGGNYCESTADMETAGARRRRQLLHPRFAMGRAVSDPVALVELRIGVAELLSGSFGAAGHAGHHDKNLASPGTLRDHEDSEQVNVATSSPAHHPASTHRAENEEKGKTARTTPPGGTPKRATPLRPGESYEASRKHYMLGHLWQRWRAKR